MDKYLIKPKTGFEQTSIALQYYLKARGIESNIAKNDADFLFNQDKYSKVIELGEVHCINNYLFKDFGLNRPLDTFYYGDFSLANLKWIAQLNIHVYSKARWPTYNFVGVVSYEELPIIANSYKKFLSDNSWVAHSMKMCGCQVELNGSMKTIDEYAKELGL